LEKEMDKLLKDFEVEPKNTSEDALRKWRRAVTIVKNPRRRFRMVADLAKRAAAERKISSIQVSFLSLSFFNIIVTICRSLDLRSKNPVIVLRD
jgi:Ca2+-transporting ATPase